MTNSINNGPNSLGSKQTTDYGDTIQNNDQSNSGKKKIQKIDQKNSDINRIHNNDPNEIHNNDPNYQSNIDSQITNDRAKKTQVPGLDHSEEKGKEGFYAQLQRFKESVSNLNPKNNRTIVTDPKTARFVIDLISVLEKKSEFGFKYSFDDFTKDEIVSIINKNIKISKSGTGLVKYDNKESKLLLRLIDMYQSAYEAFDIAMEYMAHYENKNDQSKLEHRFEKFCRVKGNELFSKKPIGSKRRENTILRLRGEILVKCLNYVEAGIFDLYLKDLNNLPGKLSDNTLISEGDEKVGDPGDIRRIVEQPVYATLRVREFLENWNDEDFVIKNRMDLENAVTMRVHVLENIPNGKTEAEQNHVQELERKYFNALYCLADLFGN